MLYKEITHEIIGCAMKVHNALGNGFQEVIYQRCLALELGNAGIPYAREVEMPIFYDDIQVGTRRADFIIDEKIMVEIKAVIQFDDVHLAQGLNYLQAYKLEAGLLINFGNTRLQLKRLFPK